MARDRDRSPAEEIRRLLAELHDGITTRELIPHYRQVRRDKTGRTVAVLDWRTHSTREPGLLAQLGVTAARRASVPVQVRRWVLDNPHPDDPARCARGCTGLCSHGRWITARTETREVTGALDAGAAVPGGSPGWDPDGALTPIVSGGKPDAAEPISEEWHAGEHIRAELRALNRELWAQGYRPPATLVSIALEDERAGRRIAARLHSLVQRARIAADYDAPVVPLRDVYCPECGGELRVRADASSAVRCAGRWTVEGPAILGDAWPVGVRCGATWPQGAWVTLLEEAERGEQAS